MGRAIREWCERCFIERCAAWCDWIAERCHPQSSSSTATACESTADAISWTERIPRCLAEIGIAM